MIAIFEQKIHKNSYGKLPQEFQRAYDNYLELVEDTSVELIAQRVAKLNGDIRVAFNIMKAALSYLLDGVPKLKVDEIRLTNAYVQAAFQEKFGSKTKMILEKLPSKNIWVVKEAFFMFEQGGAEKAISA